MILKTYQTPINEILVIGASLLETEQPSGGTSTDPYPEFKPARIAPSGL